MLDAPYLRLLPSVPVGAARFTHIENFRRSYKLLRGREVADEFPTDAAYRMNRDFPDDLGMEDAVFNLDQQLIVSERLRAFLEEREVSGVEYLPVSLLNHKGRPIKEPYAIANLLRHIDCVDKDATEHEWNPLKETAMIKVKNLTIDPERVPDDAVLFRLVHVADVIGVRRDLAQAMEDAGFTGISFTDFADYNG